jgi:putative transposase
MTGISSHVNDIHVNPVKHGLVARVCEWPHASFHRYVRRGLMPEDWAGDLRQDRASFGERSG